MPKNALVKVQGTQQFMGKEIPVVLGGFGENCKVVTDKMVAEIHNTTPREIRKSIHRNLNRFKEDVDFIDLKQPGDEITTLEMLDKLGYSKQAITLAENIYLLSERGYAKLIKIMDTDLAWEVHDQLMDEYFHLREEQQQQTLPQDLSPQLQFMINMELEQKKMQQQLNQVNHHALEAKATAEQTSKQMEIVKDAMLLDHDSWRKDCNNIINKVAKERGGTREAYREVRDEVYYIVQQRAGANLKQRVINKQDRMRREGIAKSTIDKVCQIDVIAEDKRLKEIYIAVVKEMAVKYGVN